MKLSRISLILIFGLAVFFRLYRLEANPPALNWDEVSHGYNAYSILKTGRDEWGKRFPLIFRAYGDYKLPLYIYLSLIPIKLFGLTALAVRFISLLAGLGLVGVAYLLTNKLSRSRIPSLVSAFLVALSPWSLFLSRVAVEANLAAFLFALGFYFFLKRKLLLTSLFWGLSLHSYNSARVLVPLMFLALFIYFIKRRKLKQLFQVSLVLILFLLPLIQQFLTRSGQARFFWVSLIDQGAINRIIEKRTASSLPTILARLLYNRPTYFLFHSFKNYWQHFSPQFLFLKGGSHYQFSLPGYGLLYLITAPFLVIGLGWLIKEKHWWLLFWLAIAFLPSAITRDAPHVLRSLLVLPLPMVITALGLWQVENYFQTRSRFGGKLILTTFLLGVLFQFSFWWRDYWRVYRPRYSWAWQYGYQEVVEYLKKHYSQYSKIIISKKYGEPHEFLLFYWPWEPSYYQQDAKKVWDYHAHWYWINAFDKFEFWNDWEIIKKFESEKDGGRLLLITSPKNWPKEGKLLRKINFLDGTTAFEIVAYE